MDKKHFVLDITIQVDAHDENEALEILSRPDVLQSIAKAIEANKDNLHEFPLEKSSGLIN